MIKIDSSTWIASRHVQAITIRRTGEQIAVFIDLRDNEQYNREFYTFEQAQQFAAELAAATRSDSCEGALLLPVQDLSHEHADH